MRHGRWMVALLGGVAAVTTVAAGPVAAAGIRAASSSNQAILNAGVITAADVPATWTPTKQADVGPKQYRGIAACKQVVAAETVAHAGPHKVSPVFADPASNGNTSAEDTVFALKTTAAATKYLAVFQGANTPACFQQALQKALGAQAQVGAGQPIQNLQGVGDAAIGLEYPVQANVQGSQQTYVFDVVGVRIGRAFVGFTFTNPNVTIPEGPSIVNAVVGRVQSVAGG